MDPNNSQIRIKKFYPPPPIIGTYYEYIDVNKDKNLRKLVTTFFHKKVLKWANEYSEFSYDEKDGPSFPMKRFFGDKVAEIMGEKNKKWVADQIIEIEVRDIMSHLRKSVPNLFK